MPERVNNVWGGEDKTTFLTLPSGQTVYARVLGMEQVLAAGLSSEMDILSQFVVKEHLKVPQDHKKKGEEPEHTLNAEQVMKDPELFGRMVMMVDKLIPEIVVEPSVHLHFEVLEDGRTTRMLSKVDREKINAKDGVEYIYTDRVSLQDKMYLFQWTTGGETNDPVTFRKGRQDTVVGLGDSKGSPRKAQQPARSKRR
jgi:hypothetical protein